jgi:hypothetical protein
MAMSRLAVIVSMFVPLLAQAQTTRSFVGTVVGIRPASAEIEVKPDTGEPVVAALTAGTVAQKVAPGEKDLKNAAAIQASEVAKGDRVLVTLEAGTANVRRIVVMAATDIVQRDQKDQLDWQKRGVAGIVSAKSAGQITVKARAGAREIEAVITVDDRTSIRRYAPDSVRFSDAKPGKAAEISIGDQLRARGQKSEDGLRVAAEDIVFGTFLIKAGTISAVNPESKEFTIKELGSNKPLLVKIAADSQLKQMPGMPGPMGGGPGRGAAPHGAGGRGPMGGPPEGGFDINQMLERIPPARLEDLKPGSTVVVSSTKGAHNDQLTAIMVLANADMLIQMASSMSGGRGANAAPGMNGPGMGSGDLGGLGNLGLFGIGQ